LKGGVFSTTGASQAGNRNHYGEVKSSTQFIECWKGLGLSQNEKCHERLHLLRQVKYLHGIIYFLYSQLNNGWFLPPSLKNYYSILVAQFLPLLKNF